MQLKILQALETDSSDVPLQEVKVIDCGEILPGVKNLISCFVPTFYLASIETIFNVSDVLVGRVSKPSPTKRRGYALRFIIIPHSRVLLIGMEISTIIFFIKTLCNSKF